MQKFQTRIEIESSSISIDYNKPLCLLGSCFAQEMGHRFKRSAYDIALNPGGVLFHPLPMARILNRAIANKTYSEEDLFEFQGDWMSFDHHGQFRGRDKIELLRRINDSLQGFHHYLEKASVLFITFGTAHGYESLGDAKIVSNCHRLPSKFFEKRLSSHREIVDEYWHDLMEKLSSTFPQLEVIFTVSPVRYWRNGAHQNNLSKSHLLLAVHELETTFDQVSYFPAYELVLDELRDYRFFADDMLHISQLAADHVFEKLKLNLETSEQRKLSSQIYRELRILDHRFSSTVLRDESIQKLNTKLKSLLRKNGFQERSESIEFQ